MTAASPEQFGRYALKQLVAEGGMAEIFLAEQLGAEGFSKLVALKRTLPHLSRQPEFVTMFLDEARLASRLSHPNVVQVFDFGEAEGRYFLAMEYLAGENFGQITRQAFGSGRPIPLQVALQMMVGACDGLHYAHMFQEGGKSLNLVHRDISPSNLMVTYQGGVKVLDFGIARALGRRQEATDTGVVKGKFPYCSPEQLTSPEFDKRSDVFALGVVLWELFTGQRLFKRDTELLTCQAVLYDQPPPITHFRKDLPAALDRISARALEKKPDARYQTSLELRQDLERLFTGPPARLDEYMLALFGEKHASERLNVGSDVKKIPTAADQARQGSNEPVIAAQGLAPTAPTAPTDEGFGAAPTRTGATLALTPQLAVKKAAAPPRGRRNMAVLAVVGLALLAAAGAWRAQQPGPAPTGPVVRPESPPNPPPALPTTLELTTVPAGAALEVNGKKVGRASPTTVEGLAAGEVEVKATLAGYAPQVQKLTLQAGQKASMVLPLAALATQLEVSAPEGARLFIDGVDRGATRTLEVVAGEHAVRVVLAGHSPFETKVTVEAGQTARVVAKLSPLKKAAPGKLDVVCMPWCRVFVDGKDVGRPSPIVGFEVPSGQHTLRLEHPPSGRSKETLLEIKAGETTRQQAQFR